MGKLYCKLSDTFSIDSYPTLYDVHIEICFFLKKNTLYEVLVSNTKHLQALLKHVTSIDSISDVMYIYRIKRDLYLRLAVFMQCDGH